MRTFLDRLYLATGWLSAICFLVIGGMVAVQLCGRVVDDVMRKVGLSPYGFQIPGLAEIAGYLLATASLLALALAFKSASHIRITMLLNAMGPRARFVAELFALTTSAACAAYMTWRIGALTVDSWRFNEVSYGLVPVPLAYPQAAMTLGLVVFTIAILDELVITIRTGRPSFVETEDAVTLGKEG